DNILLIDRLRRQPVIDKQTGLYNRAYLDPVLAREFDLARRRGKSLSCVKLHVDTLDKLLDTYGETAGETVLSRIGTMLTANCRSCDILVRTDIGEFVALLPEIDAPGAEHVARRIRGALETLRFPEFQGLETPAFSIGVATDPGDGIETHRDLLLAAGRNLNHDRRLTTRRAV
ncbi:MAG: GGDEF domain-containing protein, partial [Desulfuromonadales bacterium]|nr:GGDEF domain-containing protein [Desulfuromonadales bacterium]